MSRRRNIDRIKTKAGQKSFHQTIHEIKLCEMRKKCSAVDVQMIDWLIKNVLDCWEGNLQSVSVAILLTSNAGPGFRRFICAINYRV